MIKLLKYLLVMMLSLTLIGCSKENEQKEEIGSVNIMCPTGAPGIAFLSSYEKIQESGKIDFVDGSDALVAELTKKDSEYDVIVAPINLGCKLIQGNQTDYRLQGVITWGNLYIVGTPYAFDIPEGEIALFGEAAVPGKIYDTYGNYPGFTKVYYSSAQLVMQQLVSGKSNVGMLAEPVATMAISKAKEAGIELTILKDLQKECGDEGYPQAAIFVRGEYKGLIDEIDAFTNSDYSTLEELITKVKAETLKLPNEQIVVKTIDRQNVHYKDAYDCIEEITDFLDLFDIEFNEDMLVAFD